MHNFFSTGNNRLVKEIIRRSGADVQFHQSHLPNIATAIIRGHRSQIETAVKLINEKTDVQVSAKWRIHVPIHNT